MRKLRRGAWPVQCGHIFRSLLLWWWQWLTADFVSFLMGVCLCGIFFHSLAKPPPATLLKHLGQRKASFRIRNKCLPANTVLFYEKQGHEFRSCLHLSHIANRISTSLQGLVLFWLFSFTTGMIERRLGVFCSLQPSWVMTYLDGCWGERLCWPTRLRQVYLRSVRKQWWVGRG